MTRSLLLRPKALSDLDDIWGHTVERWSARQAEAYFTALNAALALLCEHPEIARLHDFTPPVRIFPFRSHLVIYMADDATAHVVRILHMRANWLVLLAE